MEVGGEASRSLRPSEDVIRRNIILHHPQRERKFVIYSDASDSVSYTHLDVYKRQTLTSMLCTKRIESHQTLYVISYLIL